MARNRARRVRTKRIFEDNSRIDQALNACPFREKECSVCEIQDCPEETGE